MNKKGYIIAIAVVTTLISVSILGLVLWLALRDVDSPSEINPNEKIAYKSIVYKVVAEEYSEKDFEDTCETISRRVYNISSEAEVYVKNNDRILVKIPENEYSEEIAYKISNKGELQFVTDYNTDKEKVWLESKDIKKAEAGYIKDDNGAIEYVVSIEFTDEATKTFAEVTGQYIGKQLTIVYDGNVKSSPYIRDKITGGKATIDGMGNFEEAEEIASFLTIGSLKLKLQIEEIK